MVYWGNNICYLRKQRNLSQDALALELGMTRVKINAHENGRTVNPTVADLITFSDFFDLPVDLLLKRDLSSVSAEEYTAITSKSTNKATESRLRVLSITVDDQNDEYVDYVPVKAKAGYLAGHADPEYIAALPKYRFPGLSKNKTFRLFPTTGDSMVPVPEGSDVLAWYVNDWQSIKPRTLCIVVMRNQQEFVFKQVTLQGKSQLELKSLNEIYAPYTVRFSDVLEIWAFDRYISGEVPLNRTELDEIKSLLLDMRRELKTNKN